MQMSFSQLLFTADFTTLNVHKYRIIRQRIELKDGLFGSITGTDLYDGYSLEPV